MIGEQACRAGLEARAQVRDEAAERKAELLANERPASYAWAMDEFSEATDEQLRSMLDDLFESITVTKGRLPKRDPDLLHGRVTFKLREGASEALAKHPAPHGPGRRPLSNPLSPKAVARRVRFEGSIPSEP